MAKSKDDIKYGTAQAKLSEDESLRMRYKHGTPLEGGKIADSETVDLFSSAHNIPKSSDSATSTDQSQSHRPSNAAGGNATNNNPTTTND
ncbi:hypothetical protein JCGZ_22663 [Jatropha curcas]|uniref:Seed maturation protein n=1 Tax=Jatropha curcas TaxID=180498 RepID=A0A067JQL1_JATCU|nr:uncharacterized protein LOC105646223 [Jatropha curcas]KDP25128.1 hypothetical protein JCGZ_22663 [Jatropha curcas]